MDTPPPHPPMTVEAQAWEIVNGLPSSIRAEAESLRQMGERERWACGRLADELIEELYPRYTKTAIRRAVSYLYHCTENTVRDRQWVHCHVTPEDRDAHPLITYHYWRACSYAGESSLDYVCQVEAYHEAYGHLPSVDTVYSWVSGQGDSLPVWVHRWERFTGLAEAIASDPITPPLVRNVVAQVIRLANKISLPG